MTIECDFISWEPSDGDRFSYTLVVYEDDTAQLLFGSPWGYRLEPEDGDRWWWIVGPRPWAERHGKGE
jgi:hypothetical protein